MRKDVIVIPEDNLIIVDEIPLKFPFEAPSNLHAIQWHDEERHMEWIDDFNHPLTESDYPEDVEPYVKLWEAEYQRILEEQNRPLTFQESKARKLSEINTACDSILGQLTATYPTQETATFYKQEQEARAYVADPTSSTPLLSALAQGRGIELADLVQRVLAKADAFAVASGSIIGQRQAFEDQLDRCTTVEEVATIVPKFVLPSQPELEAA